MSFPDLGDGFSAHGMQQVRRQVGQGLQDVCENHDFGPGNFNQRADQVKIVVKQDVYIQRPV
jgi:hypothetical protein